MNPLRCIRQSVGGDFPGVGSTGAVEISVAPVPFTAKSKLNDRQVPGNDHRDDAAFTWLEGETDRDRAGKIFSAADPLPIRSEEHTSELQSLRHLVCRLLLEKKHP